LNERLKTKKSPKGKTMLKDPGTAIGVKGKTTRQRASRKTGSKGNKQDKTKGRGKVGNFPLLQKGKISEKTNLRRKG